MTIHKYTFSVYLYHVRYCSSSVIELFPVTCVLYLFCLFLLQNLDPDSPYQECQVSVSKLKMAISKGDKDAVEMLLDGGK